MTPPRGSPGFTPRPSLSGVGAWCRTWSDRGPGSPGFTPRPSLSVLSVRQAGLLRARVAGVHAPAFVERCTPATATTRGLAGSPGFTPRPSLSVDQPQCGLRLHRAGSPGFTPRPSLSDAGAAAERSGGGSPGFTPRPSLSDVHGALRSHRGRGSPGFTPRPSLSGSEGHDGRPLPRRVAGVHAPAFVERARASRPRPRGPGGVAGVHAPAFVERGSRRQRRRTVPRGRRGSRPGLR